MCQRCTQSTSYYITYWIKAWRRPLHTITLNLTQSIDPFPCWWCSGLCDPIFSSNIWFFCMSFPSTPDLQSYSHLYSCHITKSLSQPVMCFFLNKQTFFSKHLLTCILFVMPVHVIPVFGTKIQREILLHLHTI